MKLPRKSAHKLAITICALIQIISFQNCGKGFNALDSSSLDSNGTGALAEGPTALRGKAVYESKCISCHGALSSSAVLDKGADRITWALDNVGSMTSLKSGISQIDISSLALALATPRSETSSFACNTAQETFSSARLLRMTGTELKNTYVSLLTTATWTSMSDFYYLIPQDNFDAKIATFTGVYTLDQLDAVTRFNENLSKKITTSTASVSAFFGTCASLTSFTKTCFDTFLNNRGSKIFRSALQTNDNANLWAAFTQGPNLTEGMQILIQNIFGDPRFLFHIEVGEGNVNAQGLVALSSFEIANRLSYGMTAGPPDDVLFADAVANKLKDMNIISGHVDRIAQTQNFKNHVLSAVKYFMGGVAANTAPTNTDFLQGLDASGIDTASTRDFNEYINYIVFTKNGTLRDLMTSQASFATTPFMAQVLGTGVWANGLPLFAPNHRGLLARPIMNITSSLNTPYIRRAQTMRSNLLCKPVPSPNVSEIANRPMMTEADLIALTRRQYIDKSTLAGGTCLACHSQLNELGYTTGNYDSLGRFVTMERTYNVAGTRVAMHAIDPVTQPNITSADSRKFNNLSEFQSELVSNPEFSQCMTRRSFQFMEKSREDFTLDGCRLQKMELDLRQGKSLISFFTEKFRAPSLLYKKVN